MQKNFKILKNICSGGGGGGGGGSSSGSIPFRFIRNIGHLVSLLTLLRSSPSSGNLRIPVHRLFFQNIQPPSSTNDKSIAIFSV
jgi:hypothetical protein